MTGAGDAPRGKEMRQVRRRAEKRGTKKKKKRNIKLEKRGNLEWGKEKE